MCSICLESKDLDYTTPCNHKFHKECIESWFQTDSHQEKTCPECRSTIIILSMEEPKDEISYDPKKIASGILLLLLFMNSVLLGVLRYKNILIVNNVIFFLVIDLGVYLLLRCFFNQYCN